MDYKGLQGLKGGYKRLQAVTEKTKGFMGLRRLQRLQEITRG